jgi:alpha-glucosidase (family GH31 glycosyl hydrolase)
LDSILREYRSMTGHAHLLPEWAYGLFQSKDRYKTQQELLDIAAQYRARHIPMDGLVQDWYWWKEGREGDPIFNEGYTDIPLALKTLHYEHVHAMISAWGLMDDTSETYKQIKAGGYEIPGTHVYDPTNPAGRDLYWKVCPANFLPWSGMHFGSIVQNRKKDGPIAVMPFCAISLLRSAAVWNIQTSFLSSTTSACRITGSR